MATTLYFRTYGSAVNTSAANRGGDEVGLSGTTGQWASMMLTIGRGASNSTGFANTVTGPTAGVEVEVSARRADWCTPALSADATVSGTITLNLWSSENNASANAAINAIIERIDPTGAVVSTIAQTTRTTELGTTSAAANFTVSPTSTSLVKGDHIRVRVYVDDAGTMATGFTASFVFGSPTGSVDGDSYVTFTETLTFFDTEPTGSTLYLTDTAGPAVGSATEREMWTSRGSGVQTDVVNTATGPTSPIQWTDTAGGSAVEWYSKPLAAFTLSGVVAAWVRFAESNIAANAGARVELAVCDGDGANAVVWAALNTHATDNELTASEVANLVMLAGPDVSVTGEQRLRLRAYLDDSVFALVTGHTATLYYAGAASATGDSYIILTETISEYTVPLTTISPDADTTTTGWTSTPLWSKVDEDPASPDGTVITATSS